MHNPIDTFTSSSVCAASTTRNLLATFLIYFVSVGAASAQTCVDYDIYDAGRTYPGASFVSNYVADIQKSDLFSSNGVSLPTAEQVMRQDRANVHKFGLASEMDTRDAFFA